MIKETEWHKRRAYTTIYQSVERKLSLKYLSLKQKAVKSENLKIKL